MSSLLYCPTYLMGVVVAKCVWYSSFLKWDFSRVHGGFVWPYCGSFRVLKHVGRWCIMLSLETLTTPKARISSNMLHMRMPKLFYEDKEDPNRWSCRRHLLLSKLPTTRKLKRILADRFVRSHHCKLKLDAWFSARACSSVASWEFAKILGRLKRKSRPF